MGSLIKLAVAVTIIIVVVSINQKLEKIEDQIIIIRHKL